MPAHRLPIRLATRPTRVAPLNLICSIYLGAEILMQLRRHAFAWNSGNDSIKNSNLAQSSPSSARPISPVYKMRFVMCGMMLRLTDAIRDVDKITSTPTNGLTRTFFSVLWINSVRQAVFPTNVQSVAAKTSAVGHNGRRVAQVQAGEPLHPGSIESVRPCPEHSRRQEL